MLVPPPVPPLSHAKHSGRTLRSSPMTVESNRRVDAVLQRASGALKPRAPPSAKGELPGRWRDPHPAELLSSWTRRKVTLPSIPDSYLRGVLVHSSCTPSGCPWAWAQLSCSLYHVVTRWPSLQLPTRCSSFLPETASEWPGPPRATNIPPTTTEISSEEFQAPLLMSSQPASESACTSPMSTSQLSQLSPMAQFQSHFCIFRYLLQRQSHFLVPILSLVHCVL